MSTISEVSVIVVGFESLQVLEACLASLAADVPSRHPREIFLVDNASTDGTADWVESTYPSIRVLRNTENVGFARACNQALRLARGRYVLFLNPDARLPLGACDALVERLEREPGVGLVGPRLVGGGPPGWGRTPTLCRLLRRRLQDDPGGEPAEGPVDWILGACMLGRAELLRQLGGFDEDYFLYGEDLDLCDRVAAARFSVVYYPTVAVPHLGNEVWNEARLSRVYSALSMFYRKRRGLAAWLCLRSGLFAVLAWRRLRSWLLPRQSP